MMTNKIGILLSTYNGSKFIEAQINSLFNQTNDKWHLYCRDDASKDATPSILFELKNNYPDKITLIQDNLGNLGSCKSFEVLLQNCDSNYIMFCDQDDIWLPEKIERTYHEMLIAEGYNSKIPVLICSDLKIVDKNLNIIHESMWTYMKNGPLNTKNPLELWVNNYITGCTMMINRSARDLVLPFSTSAIMHDWWIGLNVCKYGVIIALREPLILYRQHDENVFGSTEINTYYFIQRIKNLRKAINENLEVISMIQSLSNKNVTLPWLVLKIRNAAKKFIR